ncbi:type II toxin-antitoxin system RelE/ParE family toxin [Cellvibrio fontiphilus]|uniref:Type II toxin-antitoxin system RelE/ParE family toxin n=1 Tax=Cellvibrio fontiphilus TaxID=1815559 RepID=A0ABV7FI28_9GAMM
MEITFALSALSDLEHIKDYYTDQFVPHIGQKLVTDIVTHIQILFDHPDIGRIVPEFSKDYIRELIHPPFRVVYLREQHGIKIIRVWRSERLLQRYDE